MQIDCEIIEKKTRTTESGFVVPGGIVRCTKCGHAVECFAATPSKVLYGGAARLTRECPTREGNAYRPSLEAKRMMADWHQERKAERETSTLPAPAK